MFILKKILVAFLLPPGTMVVAFLLLAFYLRRKERLAALFCLVMAAFTWIGTTHAFADLSLRPLESAYDRPEKPQGDVIVMLCAGSRDWTNVLSAAENLYPHTLERAAAAALLHKKTGLPIIITGGSPFTAYPEADAVARWLEEAGVPRKALLTEPAARDTIESAANVKKLCDEKGYKKILLLTFAYHMPRSVFLFKKAGFTDLVPFPVARRAMPGAKRDLTDYLPGSSLEARAALNERLGLLVYRLRFGGDKN